MPRLPKPPGTRIPSKLLELFGVVGDFEAFGF